MSVMIRLFKLYREDCVCGQKSLRCEPSEMLGSFAELILSEANGPGMT